MGVVTAGADASSVRESSMASPVYAIEVGGQASDRVVRDLYRLGCPVVDQRIPGYLVVPLSPALYSAVKTLRGVVRIFEAAGTEFARPVTIPVSVFVHRVGELVRVVSGPYTNLSGVIQSLAQGKVQLEIVLFGRLMTISLPVESVDSIPLPEAWRG